MRLGCLRTLHNLNLHRQLFAKFVNVGDNANVAAGLRVELHQCCNSIFQGLPAQCSEAFVDK